jgi:hypothetical protein
VDAIAIRVEDDCQFQPESKLRCPNEITRFCPSIVSLVEKEFSGETVIQLELAHFSVKKYLISGNLPVPFRHGLSELCSRGYITRSCLAYLACLKTGESVNEITSQFPLARYSARYWMDYAKFAETSDDVKESIMDFFQNHAAYSTLGGLFDPERPWDENPDRNRASPLYFASLNGLGVAVQTLLGNGADVNAQGGEYGNALQAASAESHEKIVQMLLQNGADVNAQGGEYGSALQAACAGGCEKVVQLLRKNGAN